MTTVLNYYFLVFRLIITLPHDKHDLAASKYYMALLAISLPVQATHIVPVPTYGTVFFRQDQLHIDLFVFFSVFFSCFFLFLAVCVVGWKAKQVNIFLATYEICIVNNLIFLIFRLLICAVLAGSKW